MEIKEYISSGILELYSAGALTESEMKEVDEIVKYPEVRKELEDIQKNIQLIASLNLKQPSDKVKASILDKINKPKSKEEKIHLLKENSYSKQSNAAYRYLMAASIVFLILSLGTNFFLWTKLQDAKNEIAILNEQKKTIVQQYETVNKKLAKTSEDMKIIKDRNYKIVDLKGLEKSPSSNVLTFWNPETKKVYVEVVNLPVPPSNKQYQLWALNNGKPVDAGVMDVDPSGKGLHEMKNVEAAQAFAITLEPKGGSINPTLDQMYVMGKF